MSSVIGCTDLSESPKSALSPSNFYATDAQVLAGLASVYASLRATQGDYYNSSEVTTDEMVVPTRGQDWYDNGQWLELHKQNWSPTSAAGAGFFNGIYGSMMTGVARANSLIAALPAAPSANVKTMKAEARALRAYFYYVLNDAFGGVPIVTDPSIANRPRNTRAEVFAFIESELIAVKADLPTSWDAGNYGRMTQGAVDAILASLYNNAQVFTGTVTTAGLTLGTAKWTEASAAADRVINSGNYALQTGANYLQNFGPSNSQSKEIIMPVRNTDVVGGLGSNFQMQGSHYNQPEGGWNGFALLAQVYTGMSATDVRRATVRIGQQYQLDGVTKVKDRAGNDLVFTLNIADVTAATEAEGPRLGKYQWDPNHNGGDYGNDYPLFRLSEMYLIKAEAQNELGNTAAATAALNVVRTRADAANPVPAGQTQAQLRSLILAERMSEFVGEGKRRQDLIRIGQGFTTAFQYKPTAAAPYRVLFSIPSPALQTNPLLTQNPGY